MGTESCHGDMHLHGGMHAPDMASHAPCSTSFDGKPDPDLSGKCMLLVLIGSAGRRRLLHSMQSAGLKLVCYAPTKAAWAMQYITEEDWILGPPNDAAAAQQAVEAWLASPCSTGRRRIDGVLCYDEYGLQLAARLRQALGTPGPWHATPPWVVEVVRSKRLFRDACVAAGVPAPRYTHLTAPATPDHPEQLAKIEAAGLRFPVVVKPSGCAGSFAVTRADDMQQLAAATRAYYDCLPAYLEQLQLGPTSTCATGGMVVEEFVRGQEVDVDCVVVEGQLLFACVSDNHPSKQVEGVAAFVETGGCCPSTLPESAQALLLELTARVVGLFGSALSGVLHFEAKYDAATGTAVPIELNARIGGAETFTNIRAAWGVDLAHAAARIACGLRPVLPRHLLQQLQASLQAAAQLQDMCAAELAAAYRGAGGVCHLSRSGSPCSCHCTESEMHGVASTCGASADPAASAGCSCYRAARMQQSSRRADLAYTHRATRSLDIAPAQLHGDMAPAGAAGSVPAAAVCECGCTGSCCCCTGSYWDFLSSRAASKAPALSEPCTPNMDGCTGRAEQGVGDASAASAAGVLEFTSGEPSDAHSEEGTETSCMASHQVQPWVRHLAPSHFVSSINFVPDWTGEGRIEQLEVSASTKADPGYVDAEMYYAPGAIAKLPPAGFSALGWMVSAGCSHADAADAMARLQQGVTIRLVAP